jgi:hypothetical protein
MTIKRLTLIAVFMLAAGADDHDEIRTVLRRFNEAVRKTRITALSDTIHLTPSPLPLRLPWLHRWPRRGDKILRKLPGRRLCPVDDHRRWCGSIADRGRNYEPPAVGRDVKTRVGSHDSGVEQRARGPVLKGRSCHYIHGDHFPVGVEEEKLFAIAPPFGPGSAMIGDLPLSRLTVGEVS